MFHRALTLVIAFLCVVGPGVAQDQERSVLVVGYEEFRPYSFTDTAGRARGYSIDVLEHLAAETGHDLQFVAFANPREMLSALYTGEIQVTSLLAITDERRAFGTYAKQVGSYENAAFALRRAGYHANTDLTARRIGVVAGSYSMIAAQSIPFSEIVPHETQPALLVALLDGSVDAVVAPKEMFLEELHRLDIADRIEIVGEPLTQVARSFLVASGDPSLLNEINRAIDTRLTDVQLASLGQTWFATPQNKTNGAGRWLLLSAGILVILGCILVILTRVGGKPRRLFTADRNNQLLIDALNKIDLCITIYDADLRAVHWNAATAFTFPKLLPHLRNGAKLPELIELSYHSGVTRQLKTPSEARTFARQIVDTMLTGKDTTRIVTMSDGRIFEAVEFAFGTEFYAAVRKDVTKVQQQAQKINEQNHKLAIANERMQRFAEVAAHDLRAPLQHQSTLLDFIVDDFQDAKMDMPAQAGDHIDLSKVCLARMMQLVEDLLEYSRLDNGSSDAESVDLNLRFDRVLELIHLPKGFDVVCEGPLPVVRAPEAACDIVLRNLISNAIKHHDGLAGKININAQVVANTAFISISDNGPGIAQEQKARIFEPFQRLSTATSTKGSGLGLAMVARTVQAWGGDVSVQDAPGRGTVFQFSVPLASEQPDFAPFAMPALRAAGTG